MKANKKVLGAAAALTMSLAMAAGSTFAWFTTGNTATVNSFDLGVTSGTEALLVSAGKTGSVYRTPYSSELTTQQILNGNGYFTIEDKLYHPVEDKKSLFSEVDLNNGDSLVGYYTESSGNYTKVESGNKGDDSIKYYAFNRSGLFTANNDTAPTVMTALTENADYDSAKTYWSIVKLDAVTTTDGIDFTGKNSLATKSQDLNGCYVTLTLNFRISDNETYGVYLLDDATNANYISSVTTNSNAKVVPFPGNAEIAAGTYTNGAITVGSTLVSQAAYATRLSFVDESDDSDDSVKLWAPYDKTYGTAQNDSSDPGYEANTSSYYKLNLASDYEKSYTSVDGTWTTTDSEFVKPASDSMTKINFTDSSDTLKSGATSVCTLTRGDGTLTIRIWIEGDDGDCFNSILEDTLSIKMAFAAFKA